MPSWDLGAGPSYRPLGPIEALKYRIQAGWWKVRPFQLPRYAAGTPRVGRGGPLDFHLAPTAQTVGAAAMSQEAADGVVGVFDKLTPDDNLRAARLFYQWARAKYGHHWRFANLPMTLWAAATFLEPTSYLEVGVLMGRSCAVVGTVSPDCAIYGFDLWIPGYAGSENPGSTREPDRRPAASGWRSTPRPSACRHRPHRGGPPTDEGRSPAPPRLDSTGRHR